MEYKKGVWQAVMWGPEILPGKCTGELFSGCELYYNIKLWKIEMEIFDTLFSPNLETDLQRSNETKQMLEWVDV